MLPKMTSPLSVYSRIGRDELLPLQRRRPSSVKKVPLEEEENTSPTSECNDNNVMSWDGGPSAQRLVLTLALLLGWMTLLDSHIMARNNPGDSSGRVGGVAVQGPVVRAKDYFIGPCLVNTNQTCPDEEVSFFLYTRDNPDAGRRILVNETGSNLEDTAFDPTSPTKLIVHGYNSDMSLDSLVDIRREYLNRSRANLVAVDWHRLAAGPCYPVAVHNVPHVGECLAQLIDRLREYGAKDIHVIGFSLGAHVPAYSANHLRPYKLPRITGLDPAMPFFITVGKDEKLDSSDAEFVDVFHTNAFIQGKVEAVGHVDFYMNGGINQPGCWEKRNPFGCNHNRAAAYFAESINTKTGFWGWPCPGFLSYLLGLCPPRFPAILAGDTVDTSYRGFYLVRTRSTSPFAEGIFAVEPGYQLNL
ncbi:phospholipase A1-like [Copidosoma floridanum]|uniref:phospholipase A1-like n=1 Tax=Copidosoma floridanum TaxID=29053 RepID=UPI0006C99462|nr:phospholipase A1-like [Copidosoma floridanum]